MPKKQTDILVLLDQSASMGLVKMPTISGFNEYLMARQAEFAANPAHFIKLTLVTFNTLHTERAHSPNIQTVYSRMNVGAVPLLNNSTYKPDGLTPLYDAIGIALEEFKPPKKSGVLVVILTDGAENESKRFSQKEVFEMIARREMDGWVFIFLGANQDSFGVTAGMGIQAGNTSNYDPKRPDEAFDLASRATAKFMSGGSEYSPRLIADVAKKRPKKPLP